VATARAGDRVALDTLLRRHHDRLYALCRRLTANDADAADACQEALIAVARGLARFDGRSSFSTWAYRVATNAALDELRRRRRRPEPGLPADATLAAAGGPATPDVEARVDVNRALARLPADYRTAVVLRDLCDLTYEEIGEILGIPPGTVRSRIARGRAALVPLLAGDRNPGPPANRPNP
jgi:RNA polymerase sigma-70 factor (ECF subfamily)